MLQEIPFSCSPVCIYSQASITVLFRLYSLTVTSVKVIESVIVLEEFCYGKDIAVVRHDMFVLFDITL